MRPADPPAWTLPGSNAGAWPNARPAVFAVPWTALQLNRLRFLRWRLDRGDFAVDDLIDADAPRTRTEPVPIT